MLDLEEKVGALIRAIDSCHDAIARQRWEELDRDNFVFELERSTKKIKEIYLELEETNKGLRLLLEKNVPDLEDAIKEISQGLELLEKNLSLEKAKKLRDQRIHESDKSEVPELYSSLQQKAMGLALKARYTAEKAKGFLDSRKMPFVKKGSTAKALIEILQKKEEELFHVKQDMMELKRKSFFGAKQAEGPADLEKDLQEKDKALDRAVSGAGAALKSHYAQLNYVEGSYAQLKQKITEIEELYKGHSEKSSELIKELKKERDYARTSALEVEQEALRTKSHYNTELLSLEEKKQELEEKMRGKYEKELGELKRAVEEKTLMIRHMNKLLSEQENKISALKAGFSAEGTQGGAKSGDQTKALVAQNPKNLPLDLEELPFEKNEPADKPELEDFTGPFVRDPKWVKNLEKKPQVPKQNI